MISVAPGVISSVMRASASSEIVMRSSAAFGSPGGCASCVGAASSLRSFSPRAVWSSGICPASPRARSAATRRSSASCRRRAFQRGEDVRAERLVRPRDRDRRFEHLGEALAHEKLAELAADINRDRAGPQHRVFRACRRHAPSRAMLRRFGCVGDRLRSRPAPACTAWSIARLDARLFARVASIEPFSGASVTPRVVAKRTFAAALRRRLARWPAAAR